MGCTITVFQSVFSEYLGAITFVLSQTKVIAPYMNFRINSPTAIAIPITIRIAPTIVTSDEPISDSISLPLVYAENPNKTNNGGVPYAITFPISSIGIILVIGCAPPIASRFVYGLFFCSHQAS
jgi:hypothetical protein